ncbi:sigma-70 family RNA polymerase sigma factor [Streptomyces sp. NPDC002812]|uniref:RNA polymerase sigma factor n=1 Tax=Streptomyces sp. NPDC002812 TaxID=3154434 RepID=UPI00331EA36B
MPETPGADGTKPYAMELEQPLEAAAASAAADPSNKAALAELFAEMYEPVVRFMQARVNDPMTAEDLAQEVFVRVVQRIRSYTGGGIWAWVWAIARNVHNDHFRPMRNRGFEQPTPDFWHLDAPSSEMGPEETAQWNDLRRAILPKLHRLTSQQREVLHLRLTCGRTTAETAGIMGKPVGTIRVLQCRALAKLRKLMPEGDSTLATYLLSASDEQREEDRTNMAPPVQLREKNDAGSMG